MRRALVLRKRQRRRVLHLGVRVLMFLGGLLLPLLLALVLIPELRSPLDRLLGASRPAAAFEPLLGFATEVVSFKGPESVLQIQEHDASWATHFGDNVLFVTWVNLKDLPKDSDRQLVVLRMGRDADQDPRAGFGFALSRTQLGVRPWVYLRRSGEGGWFTFPEFSLVPGTWYAFAISLTRGERLGLHYGWARGPRKWDVNVLGGHLMPKGGFPLVAEPLLVGAPGSSSLRGYVGGAVFYRLNAKLEDTKKTLRELFVNPGGNSKQLIPLFGALGQRQCLKCTSKLRRAKSRTAAELLRLPRVRDAAEKNATEDLGQE